MPITRELLSEKLRKGTNGIYWLMEYFYTHDDDYKLVSSKPYATLWGGGMNGYRLNSAKSQKDGLWNKHLYQYDLPRIHLPVDILKIKSRWTCLFRSLPRFCKHVFHVGTMHVETVVGLALRKWCLLKSLFCAFSPGFIFQKSQPFNKI